MTKMKLRYKQNFNFFRSKPIGKYEIVFLRDVAFDCLVKLGILGKVQFFFDDIDYEPCDLYINEVARCNAVFSSLQLMESYMKANKMEINYNSEVDKHVPVTSDLSRIEDEVESVEVALTAFVKYDVELNRQRENWLEQGIFLDFVNNLFSGMDTKDVMLVWNDKLAEEIKQNDVQVANEEKINFFMGTMPMEYSFAFERMLYRITRGAHLIYSSQLVVNQYVPFEKTKVIRKVMFVVSFYGQYMGERIHKVLRGFHATLFDVPDTFKERRLQRLLCENNAKDITFVLQFNEEYRQKLFQVLKENLFVWKIIMSKVMKVYVELNRFVLVKSYNTMYLQAYLWTPRPWEKEIRDTLLIKNVEDPQTAPMAILTQLPSVPGLEVPTVFDLSNFTRVFQNLIDTYGVPAYKELNPAPYTIITFPFLFAVMFGDIGHGLIMTIFAAILIRKYDKYIENSRKKTSSNEICDILFAGRYVLLLMGIFSCYTGFIYNDCFSKPLNIFGSHWRVDFTKTEVESMRGKIELASNSRENYLGDPYYFGFDPVWKIAGEDSIVTFNSVKMKLAIILGVFHMLFGLILSAVNNIYYKDFANFLLVTIPQIIIFTSLFLYLVFMIFFKWANFGGHKLPPYSSSCAPSVLITFINMFLLKGAEDAPEGCMKTMFSGQQDLQYALIGMAFCCIPILLAGKPIYFHSLKHRINKMVIGRKQKQKSMDKLVLDVRRSLVYQLDLQNTKATVGTPRRVSTRFNESERDFDMLEVWIHSAIHAIDSVLGAISHTASYLRLWALSLAHEQLSGVLWNMVLQHAFKSDLGFYSSILIVLIFFIWALLTVAILVTMEGLSAFLHCLRLHWVEFQSKFFDGTGFAFVPFKFEKASMKA